MKKLLFFGFIFQIIIQINSEEQEIIPEKFVYSINNEPVFNSHSFYTKIINIQTIIHIQIKVDTNINFKFFENKNLIKDIESDFFDYYYTLLPENKYYINLTTISHYQISFSYQYLFNFRNEYFQNINLGNDKIIHFISSSINPFIQPMINIFQDEILEYEIIKKPKNYNYNIYYKLIENTSLKEIEKNCDLDVSKYNKFLIQNNKISFINRKQFSNRDFLIILIEIMKVSESANYDNLIVRRNILQAPLKYDFDIILDTNETKEFSSKNNLIPFFISSTVINSIKFNSYQNKYVPNLNDQLYFYPYFMYNSLKLDNNKVSENTFSLRFLTKETKVFCEKIEKKNFIQKISTKNNSNQIFFLQDYPDDKNEDLKLILYPTIIYGNVSIYFKQFSTDLNYILNDNEELILNYPVIIESKNIIMIKSKENSSVYLNYLYESDKNIIKSEQGKSYLLKLSSYPRKNIIIKCQEVIPFMIEIIQSSSNNRQVIISNNGTDDRINGTYKNNKTYKSLEIKLSNDTGEDYIFLLLKFGLNQSSYNYIEKETYNLILKKRITVILYNSLYPNLFVKLKNVKKYLTSICMYEDFLEKEYIYSPQNISYCFEIDKLNFKELEFQKPKNKIFNKTNYYIVLFHNESEIKIDYFFIYNSSSLFFYVIIILVLIICVVIIFIRKKNKLESTPIKGSLYELINTEK